MTTALPHPRTAAGSIATSADLEAIAAPLADRGRIASYADLLTVIIQALEAWDIEPEPRLSGRAGSPSNSVHISSESGSESPCPSSHWPPRLASGTGAPPGIHTGRVNSL